MSVRPATRAPLTHTTTRLYDVLKAGQREASTRTPCGAAKNRAAVKDIGKKLEGLKNLKQSFLTMPAMAINAVGMTRESLLDMLDKDIKYLEDWLKVYDSTYFQTLS
jgi:hypothetical protein